MSILGALALAGAIVTHTADPAFAAGHRTRGLVGGWGHGWPYAVPGWGKTRSDISFFAFHPRMGWFVADRLEIYGEATLLLYQRPAAAVSAGLGGLAGRLYWATDRSWVPYATLGAGLLWTVSDADAMREEWSRVLLTEMRFSHPDIASFPALCRGGRVRRLGLGRDLMLPPTALMLPSIVVQP